MRVETELNGALPEYPTPTSTPVSGFRQSAAAGCLMSSVAETWSHFIQLRTTWAIRTLSMSARRLCTRPLVVSFICCRVGSNRSAASSLRRPFRGVLQFTGPGGGLWLVEALPLVVRSPN